VDVEKNRVVLKMTCKNQKDGIIIEEQTVMSPPKVGQTEKK